MPVFTFSGKSASGEKVSGERVAANKDVLMQQLRRERITPGSVREKGKEFSLPTFGSGKVKTKDIAIFFRQFSVMIDAGLPLVQCLEILGANQENPTFQKTLNGVRTTVEGGATLANAMRQYPKVFDDLTTNMIEAGETGGILDVILQRLAAYVEKAVRLRSAIKVGVDLSRGGGLDRRPDRGRAAQVGRADLHQPVYRTGCRLAPAHPHRDGIERLCRPLLVVLHRRRSWPRSSGSSSSASIRRDCTMTDKLMLKAPVIGMLLRKIAVARFTRTLGTLITSGVPILEGLAITARTSGNAVLQEALMKVRKAIEEGRTIVDPLKESGVFPNMVTQMIGVGEATGAMDSMLQKIADFYEDEVDAATRDMMAMLEPVIIGFLGVSVGGIVISLYMPLFAMIGKLAG